MPAISTPSEETWVINSPVFASKTSAVFCGSSADCHSPFAKEGKMVFSGAFVVMSRRAPSLLPERSFGYCGQYSAEIGRASCRERVWYEGVVWGVGSE